MTKTEIVSMFNDCDADLGALRKEADEDGNILFKKKLTLAMISLELAIIELEEATE